jgi:DNA-binding transcriptional ArsR family regulator
MRTLSKRPMKLNPQEEKLVSTMQLLGDKTRFKIFKLMLSGKEMCVSEIAEAIDISVPAVSQQFRVFELTGLVDKQRYGQKVCYALKSNDQLAKELIKLM